MFYSDLIFVSLNKPISVSNENLLKFDMNSWISVKDLSNELNNIK